MRTTISPLLTIFTLLFLSLVSAAPARHFTVARALTQPPSSFQLSRADNDDVGFEGPAPNRPRPSEDDETFNTYYHVIESSAAGIEGVAEGILDLGAVEAAKDAIKAGLGESAREKARERVVKFRAGLDKGTKHSPGKVQ